MERIIVSRKWTDSRIAETVEITATADATGIKLTAPLDQFVAALAAQVGNPFALATKAQLHQRLKAAAIVVVQEMKNASIYVSGAVPK